MPWGFSDQVLGPALDLYREQLEEDEEAQTSEGLGLKVSGSNSELSLRDSKCLGFRGCWVYGLEFGVLGYLGFQEKTLWYLHVLAFIRLRSGGCCWQYVMA